MLAAWTAGETARARRESRYASTRHALPGTGTHIASGQSRSACDMGIAERTPNAARLVRCRADDAAALGGPTDEQQRRLARTLGVDQARDGDEERVGVDEQDPARERHAGRHERKIASIVRRCALERVQPQR